MLNALTDVAGIRVGHWSDPDHATGCTVVLYQEGAVAGVDVRGGAPGTRETDLLAPGRLVQEVHALLLAGGSAYGLDAAAGVMRHLEERGIGFRVGSAVVPIVPGAILYDLGIGSPSVRPGAEEGYQACLAASDGPVARGSVGAGTGATVGKALGMERATKGGLGTASVQVDRWTVASLVAVNALGDVVDPESGRILAGPRSDDDRNFLRTTDLLIRGAGCSPLPTPATTLAVVATDATLTKEQASVMARVGHDGLALAIRPCHLMSDGDVVFSLATGKGERPDDLNRLLAAVPGVVAQAIVDAVMQAEGLAGVPAAREVLTPSGEGGGT